MPSNLEEDVNHAVAEINNLVAQLVTKTNNEIASLAAHAKNSIDSMISVNIGTIDRRDVIKSNSAFGRVALKANASGVVTIDTNTIARILSEKAKKEISIIIAGNINEMLRKLVAYTNETSKKESDNTSANSENVSDNTSAASTNVSANNNLISGNGSANTNLISESESVNNSPTYENRSANSSVTSDANDIHILFNSIDRIVADNINAISGVKSYADSMARRLLEDICSIVNLVDQSIHLTTTDLADYLNSIVRDIVTINKSANRNLLIKVCVIGIFGKVLTNTTASCARESTYMNIYRSISDIRLRTRRKRNLFSNYSQILTNARQNILPVVVELTEELYTFSYSVKWREVKGWIDMLEELYDATRNLECVVNLIFETDLDERIKSSFDRFCSELLNKILELKIAFDAWTTYYDLRHVRYFT